MNKKLKYLSVALAGIAFASYAQAQQLVGVDVGGPTLPGSATVNGDGTTTIVGGGADIWGTADAFYFYNTPISGYYIWDAVVRVNDLQGPDTWTKAELMARFVDPTIATNQAGDPFIAVMTTRSGGQNEIRAQVRTTRGGSADGFNPSPTIAPSYPNQWLRLTRYGNVFDCYSGTDGTNWTLITEMDTSTNTWKGGDNSTTFGNAPGDNVRIGVAVTAHNDTDGSGGIATISDWTLTLKPLTTNPKTITWLKTPPATVTAYDGTSVLLSALATNDAVPNVVPCTYQWYKNGNKMTGATQPNLSFVANLTETSTKYACVISATAAGVSILSTNSGTVVTVLTGVTYTNGLKWEYWTNATRTAVESGSAGAPAWVAVASSFDMPSTTGNNNYAQRVSGYFIPQTSGTYSFFIASDDTSDLFFSTDSNPAHKMLIAQQTSWNDARMWASGSNPTQRSSDSFTPDDGATTPYSSGFALTAGQKYYIEGVMEQGSGGDNFDVTYELTGSSPADGDYSLLQSTNGNIGFQTGLSTNLVITTQPVDVSVFDGDFAKFSFAYTTDSELTPTIQWYKNDQPVSGATSVSWKPTVLLKDSGAKVYVVIKVPETSLVLTSSVVTLTVQQAVFETGFVKREFWSGGTRAPVENGTAADPTYLTTSYAFEGSHGSSGLDNYAERLSCLFVPPSTGDYAFTIYADDDADLFISTDASPANKYLIAQQTSWSAYRAWNASAQCDSAQYTPDSGTTIPYASGIHLIGGQQYYLEGVTHNGSGGYDFGATYRKIADGIQEDNSASLLTGSVIGFKAPAASYIGFTQQPTNVTTPALTTVTFSAVGATDSKISIGDDTSTFVMYQWYKNGSKITGATASSYTTPYLKNSDNGNSYVCAIRALGVANWSNSTPATVTVVADTNVPTVLFATFRTNDNTGINAPVIDINFSKRMDLASLANIANYTVAGATIYTVFINSNSLQQVELVLSDYPTLPVTVTFSGLKDYSGIAMAANASVQAKTPTLINTDIGTPGTDPALPGFMIQTSTNSFVITCEGSDMWGTADAFNFSYELKTNDFDVIVRQVSTTHSSTWAKGGLVMRESLDPGSRHWNILNTPASADGINAPDSSGTGANQVVCQNRVATNGDSASWENMVTTAPVPSYPNAWLRLKRVGQMMYAYNSINGVSWTPLGTNDVTTVGDKTPLPSVVYLGIGCTAHNNDTGAGATPYLYIYTGVFDNYNSSYVYVAPQNPASLSAKLVGSNVVVSWTPDGGHLESSPTLGTSANWTQVGTTSPVTLPATGTTMFFRVVNP